MNANDKSMLEKVRAGWWVQTLLGRKEWFLVCAANGEYFQIWSLTDTPGVNPIHTVDTYITALHRPTDDPSMETAYLLGEPEEVTREEAEKMVKSNWYWLLPDDQQIRHAIDVLPLENINLMVETAYAIESPGGNVYRIKD